MVNIVLDCMGGENSPNNLVKGVVLALNENKNINIILVGKDEKIIYELKKYKFDKNRVDIINANDVIEGNDEPVKAMRMKKNSSLIVALNEIVNKNYDAIVSTGNSGAFLAGCLFLVGRIKGVNRAALAPIINSKNNKFILLDAGANVDCKVVDFVQFAKIGSVYYKILFGEQNPIVKLLNIGVESNKGNFIVKRVYDELLNDNSINFKGNIEARYIMDDDVNVVVCDGFVGNIVLKTIEGTSKYIMSKLKDDMNKSFIHKIGKKIFFSIVKNKYDYQKYGGAIFLGVKKICIKSHGNSNEIAIKNSIDMAYKLNSRNFIEVLEKNLFIK